MPMAAENPKLEPFGFKLIRHVSIARLFRVHRQFQHTLQRNSGSKMKAKPGDYKE